MQSDLLQDLNLSVGAGVRSASHLCGTNGHAGREGGGTGNNSNYYVFDLIFHFFTVALNDARTINSSVVVKNE